MEAIPPIDLLIQNLAEFNIFTTLNLKYKYYNVSLDPQGAHIGFTTFFW